MPYTAITHDSRHPFETYILTAGVLAGGSAVFGDLWPTAIEEAFPVWAQAVWGILFGGGALIALIGIALKKRDTGILLEQVGLTALGAMCITYSGAIFVFNRSGGFAVSVLLVLIGAACFRQWWRLEKFVRATITRGRRARRFERGTL